MQIFDGAEFTDSDIPFLGNSIILLCSQSGETKDLHRCINIARNCQVVTVGIINVIDSIIAREVDCGIYLNARREVAVASTKSFTSMLVVLLLLSLWISQKVGSKKIQYNVIIDGTNIGATTPGTGAFTTLTGNTVGGFSHLSAVGGGGTIDIVVTVAS